MRSIPENRWRQISETISSSDNIDEENTKRRIIDPLLIELGWDLFGEDVIKEYKVQIGSKNEKVDYSLMIDNIPKIFIEVKRLNTKLTDSDAKQGLSYAIIERVRWCILSNGKIFKIYNTDWGNSPEKALFRTFELDPKLPPPEELNLFSKKYIENGELDHKAGQSRINIRVKAILSEIIEELREDAINKARNKIYKQIKDEMPNVTREMVLEVIEPILQIQYKDEESISVKSRTVVRPITDKIIRNELEKLPDGLVAVFPSKPAGVDWMKRFSAWGYVRIKTVPDYFALYISKPDHSVQYFAEIDKIVDPSDPESPVRDQYEGDWTYKPGKKVILLKKGSIRKLDPEIPYGKTKKSHIQGLKFCKLDNLIRAKSMDDLW